MFTSANIIDEPGRRTSIIQVVGDRQWATDTCSWLKANGLDCDVPEPASWQTIDRFKVFGYHIIVRENRSIIMQRLNLQ